MKTMHVLLLAVVLGLSAGQIAAKSTYRQDIPNGVKEIDGATGYGHISKSGGGARNQFGLDFASAGRTWEKSLCCKDSE